MDLSSLFGNISNYTDMASALGNLYGGVKNYGIANTNNNSVQSQLGSNTTALQSQLAQLQSQQAQQTQQAQDQYNQGLQSVQAANSGLQGNIGSLTTQLQALSDPNSAYMQDARQAIERKDAAAGRNSQWGDRETQLAGTLGQYVAQYSPGMQNAITQAQGQISQNNQGLASLYANAYKPAQTSMQQQIDAIKSQITNAQATNTTGLGAANGANNALTGTNGILSQLGKMGGSIAGLFGGTVNNANANPYNTTADASLVNTPEQDQSMASYYTPQSGQQYNYGGDQYDDSYGLYNF